MQLRWLHLPAEHPSACAAPALRNGGAAAKTLCHQCEYQRVQADIFGPGALRQFGVNGFWQARNKFAGHFRHRVGMIKRFGNFLAGIGARSHPCLERILAVGDSLGFRGSFRHAAGKVRKDNQESAAVFIGKLADDMSLFLYGFIIYSREFKCEVQL